MQLIDKSQQDNMVIDIVSPKVSIQINNVQIHELICMLSYMIRKFG